MKKFIVILLSISLIYILFTPSVYAGRHHRHGGEAGIILGTLLLLNFWNHHPRYYEPRPCIREPRIISRGHWEEICQPPVYKRVSNPGHYNRHGKWIPNRYQRIRIRDGYCKRVWVRW